VVREVTSRPIDHSALSLFINRERTRQRKTPDDGLSQGHVLIHLHITRKSVFFQDWMNKGVSLYTLCTGKEISLVMMILCVCVCGKYNRHLLGNYVFVKI